MLQDSETLYGIYLLSGLYACRQSECFQVKWSEYPAINMHACGCFRCDQINNETVKMKMKFTK